MIHVNADWEKSERQSPDFDCLPGLRFEIRNYPGTVAVGIQQRWHNKHEREHDDGRDSDGDRNFSTTPKHHFSVPESRS
jgi:hypothetical protein